MVENDTRRWIIAAIVLVLLVGLLAYARRNPPFDDRVPDTEDSVAVLVV
jgi:hypothetical protein